ncbi:hypothetical protein ACSBR2_030728 [Camellia fascicularis]
MQRVNLEQTSIKLNASWLTLCLVKDLKRDLKREIENSFAVDKQSGKKCFMLPARQLGIAWGGTPQYWTWISLPESRFLEVAHLVKVCWFDIGGRLNTQILSPETNYAAYFVFKITERNYGFEYAPMKASVTLVGDTEDKTIYLKLQTNGEEDNAALGPLPRRRKDGWMEIELGEFFNERDNDREVEIKLMEIEHLNWKSGLIVEGIELRPKVDAQVKKRQACLYICYG